MVANYRVLEIERNCWQGVVGVTSTGFTARKIFVEGGEELTMLGDWSSSGGCGWRGGILGRRPQLFPTDPITTKPLRGVMVRLCN